MIDPKAPIIPAMGAAGIAIGMKISDVTSVAPFEFKVEDRADGVRVYRSEMVDLWVRGDSIFQIMVHGPYEGKLLARIGIGSSLKDVEEHIGPVSLDEEDNLIIEGVKGLSIEINPETNPSTIEELYIFDPNAR
ncbi:MAG TPA: hypothetical protein VN724_14850 [Pyrinomonadaceae bacterium]|nr:hypothetical protein [Pyrinomonadaceae bacterium]